MEFLPAPRVVRCFFEKQFQPHLPAMELAWNPDAPGVAERTWYFPDNVFIKGPAPEKFGVVLKRLDHDRFHVRLLWNDVCMTWNNLRKVQIMTSGLALVLRALGTDLWYLLEQPMEGEERSAAKVA
jgi:hypothetical protein